MSRIQVVLNYISVTQPIATAIVLSSVPLLYIILRKVLTNLSAPIRELAGPKSVRWLTGSLDSNVWEPDAQDYQIEWTLKYGPVFRYNGFFNVSVTLCCRQQIGPSYVSSRPRSSLRISKH